MYMTYVKSRTNQHWYLPHGQGRLSACSHGLLLAACLCTPWAAAVCTSAAAREKESAAIENTLADQIPQTCVSGLRAEDAPNGPGGLVEICEWQGGAAGAASISIDDSCTSCRSLLNQYGFKGTYYLSGTDAFTEADWAIWRSVYREGHEIGGHTTSHVSCHVLDEKTLRWELVSNRTHILTNVGMPAEELTSLAWPRGDCSPASEAIAAEYYISARGYHINELEDKDPCDFMNLKSVNTPHYHVPAYDPPDYFQMADKAEALGKWVSYVFHNRCQDDGAIAYLATKDLWVAPVGTVVKYIKERQNSHILNVAKTDSKIAFTLACRLEPHLFNQELTVRVRVAPDEVESVMVNGTSTAFARDADHILFNVRPSGSDEIMVATIGPARLTGHGNPELGQERHGGRLKPSTRLDPGNGAVINIWISGQARLDNLRNHRIRYLFVDVGDTNRGGKIETPIAEIIQFLSMIKSYEKQHAYDFVMLPYSEINTSHCQLDHTFRENFVADYKRLMALGFDGIYVDVEPVRSSLRADYLEFLNELSAICPEPAILGVYAGSVFDPRSGQEEINEWQWSVGLYRDVSSLVDLIVVPGYDFKLRSRKEYTRSIRKQISLLSSEVLNCRLMFAVPTHKPEPETIGNALAAYKLEISRRPRHQFIGVCIFAEWTTIPEEWNVFESGTQW
jgi:Polysaccharide deacetylase